jgi:hypothetical protein
VNNHCRCVTEPLDLQQTRRGTRRRRRLRLIGAAFGGGAGVGAGADVGAGSGAGVAPGAFLGVVREGCFVGGTPTYMCLDDGGWVEQRCLRLFVGGLGGIIRGAPEFRTTCKATSSHNHAIPLKSRRVSRAQ